MIRLITLDHQQHRGRLLLGQRCSCRYVAFTRRTDAAAATVLGGCAALGDRLRPEGRRLSLSGRWTSGNAGRRGQPRAGPPRAAAVSGRAVIWPASPSRCGPGCSGSNRASAVGSTRRGGITGGAGTVPGGLFVLGLLGGVYDDWVLIRFSEDGSEGTSTHRFMIAASSRLPAMQVTAATRVATPGSNTSFTPGTPN